MRDSQNDSAGPRHTVIDTVTMPIMTVITPVTSHLVVALDVAVEEVGLAQLVPVRQGPAVLFGCYKVLRSALIMWFSRHVVGGGLF